MKIDANQELKEEDFAEQRKWISPMFFVLNRFIRGTLAVVNGNLEWNDNIKGIQHDFEFKYQSVSATFPLDVAWPYTTRPKAFEVVHAEEDDAVVRAVADLKYVEEFDTSGALKVVRLSNAALVDFSTPGLSALTAGNKYKIRVRIS